jgi:uncharacterized protein YutE (UPF0331/DUF86 family)
MSKINLGVVRERAREIRESMQKVQAYAAQADDVFFADERNLLAVMHLLLIAIEATAAICTHLAAKTAERAPDSYADCFDWLHAEGKVDDELAARLIQMARFRNPLVHRYWNVDSTRVLAYARQNLGDFDAYPLAISGIIGQPV